MDNVNVRGSRKTISIQEEIQKLTDRLEFLTSNPELLIRIGLSILVALISKLIYSND